MTRRPTVILLDVIETLFALEPLRPRLQALGLPAGSMEGWFAASLRDSFALAATGGFAPLREILDANLDTLLQAQGLDAAPADRARVLDGMAALPPHPDVEAGLRRLHAAGIRLLALSNGGAEATAGLFEAAGLDGLLAGVVTTGEVGLSKPRGEVYAHALARSGVPASEAMLVAAHPWDIHGAAAAGLRTGYLARNGAFPPVFRAPELGAATLPALAEAVLALPG